MSVTNNAPDLDGFHLRPVILTAAAVNSATNSVPPRAKVVEVQGVATDANDWITLPSLATVANGHEIIIIGSAGANFEMRTPAASNEKINNVDSDGTQEYLFTDTQIVRVIKIDNTIGWMAHGFTAIGAVAAAVIPD